MPQVCIINHLGFKTLLGVQDIGAKENPSGMVELPFTDLLYKVRMDRNNDNDSCDLFRSASINDKANTLRDAAEWRAHASYFCSVTQASVGYQSLTLEISEERTNVP